MSLMTAGIHTHNYRGCVAELVLNNQRLDLMANAIDGRNVKPCESWRHAKWKWLKALRYV